MSIYRGKYKNEDGTRKWRRHSWNESFFCNLHLSLCLSVIFKVVKSHKPSSVVQFCPFLFKKETKTRSVTRPSDVISAHHLCFCEALDRWSSNSVLRTPCQKPVPFVPFYFCGVNKIYPCLVDYRNRPPAFQRKPCSQNRIPIQH